MKKYPLFSHNVINDTNNVINIEIKTWAKGIEGIFTKDKIKGIEGRIKNVVYSLLKGYDIKLYIIDLNFKNGLINTTRPTFLKLNVMFNPEKIFTENKIDVICSHINDFLKTYEVIHFNPNKNELN